MVYSLPAVYLLVVVVVIAAVTVVNIECTTCSVPARTYGGGVAQLLLLLSYTCEERVIEKSVETFLQVQTQFCKKRCIAERYDKAQREEPEHTLMLHLYSLCTRGATS